MALDAVQGSQPGQWDEKKMTLNKAAPGEATSAVALIEHTRRSTHMQTSTKPPRQGFL